MPALLIDSQNHRIYGSCLFDYLTYERPLEMYEKSRFIKQKFDNKHNFLRYATTVSRAPLHLMFSIITTCNELEVKKRDVNKVFVQAISEVRRKVYLSPSSVLKSNLDTVLRQYTLSLAFLSFLFIFFRLIPVIIKKNYTRCRQFMTRSSRTQTSAPQIPCNLLMRR